MRRFFMEKTVKEIFDEMSPEQQFAIITLIEEITKKKTIKHSSLMHYGVKGMKWGVRKAEGESKLETAANSVGGAIEEGMDRAEDIAEASSGLAKLAVDQAKLQLKIKKFENSKKNFLSPVYALGLQAAKQVLKVKKNYLTAKLKGEPAIKSVIKYESKTTNIR